jgi:hypothetical protein
MTAITSLHAKAPEAPTLFSLLAAIAERKLCTEYPQIMIAPRWSVFKCTFVVAGCHALAMRLHFDVAEQERTPTEEILQTALRRYDHAALNYYTSCHYFVTDGLITLPRAQRPDATFLFHALWLLACVTDEQKLVAHELVAAFLGGLFKDETSGYWTTPA